MHDNPARGTLRDASFFERVRSGTTSRTTQPEEDCIMTQDTDRRTFLQRSSLLAAGAAAAGFHPVARAATQSSGDLSTLGAVAAVTAMRNGDIKCEDYARALLDRAQRLESLNAFRTLRPEMVMEAARAVDQARASGAVLGALHGLPVPVKDSVNTKSLPTSNGTGAFRDYMPKEDAAVVTRLLSQGALVMGKTNIHELSYGWTSNNGIYGPVRNPYDRDRVPGGSSGGSGAAVAARMAPLAVAEDTLGSIKVPSTMCGLAGLRPSYGRYSGDGIMPLTMNKFDQVGPVARSVADLALFDAAISGDAAPVSPTPLKDVRIGISPEYFMSGLDAEVERISADALRRLSKAGATLVWADAPESIKNSMNAAITIIVYETVPAISAFLEEQGTGVTFERMMEQASEGVQGVLKAFALPPNRPSKETYEWALNERERIRSDIAAHFRRHGLSALAFPPVMIPPPKIGEEAEVLIGNQTVPLYVTMARNTALGSCASMASLILPAGMTAGGLPVGIEFDALNGGDKALLSLGLSMEKALGPIPGPNV